MNQSQGVTMSGLGHNTASAQELMAFIERRENLEGQRKDLGDDVKVVNAEIAASGFVLKAVNAVIKIRKAKPHDFQEGQALLETYLHAIGMSTEPPLMRFSKNAAVDRASLDSVITYMGLDSASPALIRQFCEQLKRQIVIGPKLAHDMRKETVFERLVTTVQPHPTLGKPPMWASADADRARDRAVQAIPWPLPKASDVVKEPMVAVAVAADANVFSLAGRRP
jgi:uncharacterized protein (UPF0335 family)